MKTATNRTAYRKWIRTIMASLDINAKELAKRTDLSHSYVRGLISGTYTHKKGQQKLEASLGVKIWSDPETEVASEQRSHDREGEE